MNSDEVVTAVFGGSDDSTLAVEHVFKSMAAMYGAAWDRSFGATPMKDSKTAWAFQLGQFTHSQTAKRAILWALQNLPDFVPSAIAFRNLCRSAPSVMVPALPAPKADPVRIASELAKLGQAKAIAVSPHGMKAWVYRLKERHDRGEELSPTQLRYGHDVLGDSFSAAV
jgi:hypothetical protein